MTVTIEHTEVLTHAEAEHLACTYCDRVACPDECEGVQLVEACATLATSCLDCHRDYCRASECADAWEE